MPIRGFHHLAIRARDLERMAAFYTDVLELTELARGLREDGSLRSIWVGLPDGFLALEAVGEGEGAPSSESGPGLHLLAFRIDRGDRPRLLERLRARRVEVERQSRWTVYFRDPEGNRIAASHHPADPID